MENFLFRKCGAMAVTYRRWHGMCRNIGCNETEHPEFPYPTRMSLAPGLSVNGIEGTYNRHTLNLTLGDFKVGVNF